MTLIHRSVFFRLFFLVRLIGAATGREMARGGASEWALCKRTDRWWTERQTGQADRQADRKTDRQTGLSDAGLTHQWCASQDKRKNFHGANVVVFLLGNDKKKKNVYLDRGDLALKLFRHYFYALTVEKPRMFLRTLEYIFVQIHFILYLADGFGFIESGQIVHNHIVFIFILFFQK